MSSEASDRMPTQALSDSEVHHGAEHSAHEGIEETVTGPEHHGRCGGKQRHGDGKQAPDDEYPHGERKAPRAFRNLAAVHDEAVDGKPIPEWGPSPGSGKCEHPCNQDDSPG